MSDRGQPVKTVPEGAPSPTEKVLQEQMFVERRGPASRRLAELGQKAEQIEAMLKEHAEQGEYLKGLIEAFKSAHGGPEGEYQGPGSSVLEEHYEARDKPGSKYRTGETILPEADVDPLIEGMAIDKPPAPKSSTMAKPGDVL